jgi:hypothetical protein
MRGDSKMSEETNVNTVNGIDLSTLTADQLLALSKTEWEELKAVFAAALEAKAAEENAALKAKIAKYVAYYKNYVLPVIKYVAGIAVVLKVFGVI